MHKVTRGIRVCMLTLVLLSSALTQAETMTNIDRDSLLEIISAVEYGWKNADGTPFYEHFFDHAGARYIESGGQNIGLSNLVEHHVEPEGDMLDGLDLVFSKIEIVVEDDFAWAIADVEVKAVVKKDGRAIHNRGYETFLFRRIGDAWKVLHTHSSSRPVPSD